MKLDLTPGLTPGSCDPRLLRLCALTPGSAPGSDPGSSSFGEHTAMPTISVFFGIITRARLHKSELNKNWENMRQLKQFLRIEPLK